MGDPLIIDYGTGNCEAGFFKEPSLKFVNVNEKREDGIYVGLDCNTRPRSAFDRDFLTSHGALDNSLDYIFSHLKLKEPPKIAMSETFCNPYSCRNISNEVLFECFNIPKVSYFVDTLTSFNEFENKPLNSVVIDLGNFSTRVVGMRKEKNYHMPVYEVSKCIPFGKSDAVDTLMKLLQLKYPNFPIVVQQFEAQSMFEKHSEVAMDYNAVLKDMADPKNLSKYNVTKQYPFLPEESLTEEEILYTKEKQMANRKRLREMNLAKRIEKLESFRNTFADLRKFMEKLNGLKKSERMKLLKENNYKSFDDVEEFSRSVEMQIAKLEISVAKSEELMIAMDVDNAVNEASKDELSEEYMEELKSRRKLLLGQLEVRKLDTTRRSASSNNRMRGMARIIDESNKETPIGDNFGMVDSDWNVYHDIKSKNGQGLDIEIELGEIEDILVRHDPSSLANKPNIQSWLAHNGPAPVMFELHGRTVENVEFYNKNQMLAHQLHLNVERFRIPESLFKPYLVGLDERGISEILEHMYKSHKYDTIYLTGCMSKLPQLAKRIQYDLKSLLPTGTNISVINDTTYQSYIGAYNYYRNAPESVYVTRKEYQEFGGEYLKEHAMGNRYSYYEEDAME